MPERRYTLLIVDDHPLVRAGIRLALEKEERYQVLGECSHPSDVLSLLQQLKPDLVLIDIQLGADCSLEWLDCFQGPRLTPEFWSYLGSREARNSAT